MPLSKAQMLCVHKMRHTTFVSLRFSQNTFCGHSTFLLQTIDNNICHCLPLPPVRQHLSYDDCLVDKREDYQY